MNADEWGTSQKEDVSTIGWGPKWRTRKRKKKLNRGRSTDETRK